MGVEEHQTCSIGKMGITSKDELKTKPRWPCRLQKLPAIVRGFLHDPNLAYVTELIVQLRGHWLNPGAKLALCLGFASVSQIAVEGDGIRALTQDFRVLNR
jgi:hypothetical protein